MGYLESFPAMKSGSIAYVYSEEEKETNGNF